MHIVCGSNEMSIELFFGLININALFYCLSHLTMWGHFCWLRFQLKFSLFIENLQPTSKKIFVYEHQQKKNYHFSFWRISFCHGMPTVATVCWMLLISPASTMISHYQIKSITRMRLKGNPIVFFMHVHFFRGKYFFTSCEEKFSCKLKITII